MKNNTSEILSELTSIVSSKIDESKNITIKKNQTDSSIALVEIINQIKIDAQEEEAFENAKKIARLNYANEEKRKQDLQEQQKIALQIAELDRHRQNFILNKFSNEDTPPTPLPSLDFEPIYLSHLNSFTEILTLKELNRRTNIALLHKFKMHLILILFIFSLTIFYKTSNMNLSSSTSKIILPVEQTERLMFLSKPIEINLWPNYVWKDIFSNVSPDAPDLIFKYLYNNSIEINKELNRDKEDISGDKKTIKKKKKLTIKKEKIQFNMHEQD